MSQINFAQLLRAGEGLTQWRPMLLGFLTLVAAAVLMVVGVAAGAPCGVASAQRWRGSASCWPAC